eukprot:TRINITY_DN3522_c0_g1_i1.p1 TRINITY_DN3522_c0_g1~~TRINITY_DN3522_c0_g1_i1.p1  ORF type:complete len:572 (+),score=130.65 TRINITY_DN3522_c0_g1_i1:53-1717(+)
MNHIVRIDVLKVEEPNIRKHKAFHSLILKDSTLMMVMRVVTETGNTWESTCSFHDVSQTFKDLQKENIAPNISIPSAPKKLSSFDRKSWQDFFNAMISSPSSSSPLFHQLFATRYNDEDTIAPIRKEGLLRKKKMKTARKGRDRYCLIRGRTLFYYSDVDHRANPIGQILLDRCIIYKPPPTDKKHSDEDRCQFILEEHNTHYRMEAQTEADRDAWVLSIESSISDFKNSHFRVNGSISVRVIEGKNLASKDLNGRSDPFAMLFLESQAERTPTIYRNLNPIWPENTSFLFTVQWHSSVLNLLLWDEDKLSASDFMGRISIPISQLPNNEEIDVWVPLCPTKAKQNITGSIHLLINYSYVACASEDSQSSVKVYAQPPPKEGIPPQIMELMVWLENNFWNTDGIFRISGALSEVQAIQLCVDLGKPTVYQDGHAVAGAVKKYFRELPEPVLTYALYDSFLELSRKDKVDVAAYKALLSKLPPNYYLVARDLLLYVHRLSKLEATTRMGVANLSVVFGPSLLKSRDSEGLAAMMDSPSVCRATSMMIECAPLLFA